jgi:hypothetical protein
MIGINDFIRLPYTPDLTEGGIAYALRSLPYTFDRGGSSTYERLRRAVAGVAVELAFRRYLSQENIPFEVTGALPFTEPDRYDVTLGGRRCDIKSFLILHRDQISEMHRNPDVMLNAPALVPSDQHAADGYVDSDLYLFAFITGLIAASLADLKKTVGTGQPIYLVHTLPKEWSRPLNWNPLGPLTLKSESEEELLVEISGQNKGREFLTRTLSLPPKTKVVVDDPFYSLATVHIRRLPDARVGIQSAARKELYLITPLDWGNIWVYGMDIYLAGYISRDEFRRHASMIAPNSRVFQYSHTHVKNLAVPVSDLNPLNELFEKVREWEANNSQ